MTNSKWFKEWIKNKIDEMTDDELSDFICYEYAAPKDDMNYKIFATEWLNQEHQKPMPELKDGMFVEIDGQGLGVVLSGNVVLKNGLYGTITAGLKSEVSKVYDTVCFNLCDKSTCIWEKE